MSDPAAAHPPDPQPESPEAYKPELPGDDRPESPPDYRPESPPDYRPESPPDYRPESPRGYRPESGCAAMAERRGDLLFASGPPAERWLLIESYAPWPRDALTALRATTPRERATIPRAAQKLGAPPPAVADSAEGPSVADGVGLPSGAVPPPRGVGGEADPGGLAAEVARLCAAAGYRAALIRRPGRVDRMAARRWAMVDCRPGHESIRWGELPSDDHLLKVLAGADPGTPSTEPIYLVCTHGRHDACCAVRGRPAAAALAAAYPDRTWECSHIGGDRFAANLVFLPHSLYYGQVPPARAVLLAERYDEGLVVPDLLRGSGALSPVVQAAQHFARAAGSSHAVDALRPIDITQLAENHWRVLLDDAGQVLTVEVAASMLTVDGALTCASKPPGRVRTFTLLNHPETLNHTETR